MHAELVRDCADPKPGFVSVTIAFMLMLDVGEPNTKFFVAAALST